MRVISDCHTGEVFTLGGECVRYTAGRIRGGAQNTFVVGLDFLTGYRFRNLRLL